MYRPPNAFGAPPPPRPPPWQWQQPPPAVSFWQRDNVRDHLKKLQDTIEISRALENELEEIAVTRGDPGDASARSSSSAKLAPESGGHSSQEKPLHLLKISPEAHESMAIDAANYLCYQLQHLLAPVYSVINQSGPWEERSAMVRLTQKLQKSKRNKRWRKRKRKHVAELYQKVESMKEIAKKKANEERKRLESELELALMVEKLQELHLIRVQKLKKQGHFLPEEDDKYLERVKAAVEEEERQAATAARTDAVKDTILIPEESRRAKMFTGAPNVGFFIRPGKSRIPGHWFQPPPPADEV